jgi:hypothetical protein
MRSLCRSYECMNIVRVNIGFFTGFKKIKVELHRSFLYILFFQEKMLGDISFKLETKIMNFMSIFFRKKYNQVNSSVVNNMQVCRILIIAINNQVAFCM